MSARPGVWVAVIGIVMAIIAYTQLTLFVVPPIGAVPEGRTILMLRGAGSKFIDSPDAMCIRIQEYVNLICRGMVLGGLSNATILARLPYSRTLDRWSTGGVEYTNPPKPE